MESIGFKEWSLVCDALGRGEQSIILRKGGIAESRNGFSFRHREFFLFPTFFHEQIGKVRTATQEVPEQNGEIEILLWAKVEKSLRIESLGTAEALASLHVLSADVVRERFAYRNGGLGVAFLRVFGLERPWVLANEKRFDGCRSWVELPEPPQVAMQPVLDDAEQAERRSQFETVLGGRSVMSFRAESRNL